jgi:hypothetical protein
MVTRYKHNYNYNFHSLQVAQKVGTVSMHILRLSVITAIKKLLSLIVARSLYINFSFFSIGGTEVRPF